MIKKLGTKRTWKNVMNEKNIDFNWQYTNYLRSNNIKMDLKKDSDETYTKFRGYRHKSVSLPQRKLKS